ncbi:hypothetical protein KBB68_01680 [Candidatus Babeliales bacterium]|nr:hypothetical protein [Candidatus Babeliales bacterium]
MKNLKRIILFWSILTCNITLPSDVEYIDTEYEEPIIDKKAKMKYTGMRYRTESVKVPEEISQENLEREEKLKKFRQQDKAAKKIQTEWRLRKKSIPINLKLLDNVKLSENNNIIKNKLRFVEDIENVANKSYPKFKELICTSDYLTKTDWLYQFIEAVENKTIFEKNTDGKINPEKFTPEFEKEIANPDDWLNNKIIQYLPEFHNAVYQIFIFQAVEQIAHYKISWADAVSIPAPKGHDSFQEKDTPLYPKAYKFWDLSGRIKFNEFHSILGRIFCNVFREDPERFQTLHLLTLIRISPYETLAEDSKSITKRYNLYILDKKADQVDITYNPDGSFISEDAAIQKAITEKSKDSDFITIKFLTTLQNYFDNLGLEFSPEEETLKSLIGDEYLEPFDDQSKFLQDHINWASSARQTFYLGQLIFDKSLTAFDALGGQDWLKKQPKDMQEYLTNYIEKIKNSPKIKRFKQKDLQGKPVHAKKI